MFFRSGNIPQKVQHFIVHFRQTVRSFSHRRFVKLLKYQGMKLLLKDFIECYLAGNLKTETSNKSVDETMLREFA